MIVEWLENNMISCPVYSTTGIPCPGCGMQRAVIELLKGNLWDSFIFYPPLIPIFIMISFLIFHLIFKFENGAKILKFFFILNTIIISLNYIVKTGFIYS